MSLNIIITTVLFTLVFLALHTYCFYPILIKIISSFYSVPRISSTSHHLSVLISAYNEEKVIGNRIINIAKQNYDLSKIEVIVGSDNSIDGTNEILRNLEKKYNWLHVKYFALRRGKAAVINDLAKHAQNEILVFSDANTEFDKDALKKISDGFGTNEIGGVCGRLILDETKKNKFASVEEKKYWEYETFIKRAEGRCGVLIGANGGIFAIRKSLFKEIPPDAVTDDFYITLAVLQKDFKFIYKHDSIAFEEVTYTVAAEYRRKVRFSATNFQTLFSHSGDLLFNKNILLSFAFWSHKVIRWFFPFILIFTLSLSFVERNVSFNFSLLFYAQILFYALGLFGLILSFLKIRVMPFSIVYFFIVSNIAILHGFIRYVQGKQTTIWQSTSR